MRDEVASALEQLATPPAPSGPGRAARKSGGQPVIVQQVTSRRNDDAVTAVGTARARRSVTIYPKLDGVITKVGVTAGDRVEAGQLLFQLDTTKAQLAVDIARNSRSEAKRMLDRAERLERRSVNSAASVEDARTTFDRTALQVQQAEEALADHIVRAPFEGIAGLPKVDVGERVVTSTAVVTLDMRRDVLVQFEVPEKHFGNVSVGDTVSAVTPSRPGETFTGTLEYVDSRINPTSRTATVRAAIPNPADHLRPGMSFALELLIPGKPHPAVPELSVQWRKGESFIWLVRDGKAQQAAVRVVQRLNGIVLVDGAVTSDDLVVVEGVQRLRSGTAVTFASPRSGAPQDTERDRQAMRTPAERG